MNFVISAVPAWAGMFCGIDEPAPRFRPELGAGVVQASVADFDAQIEGDADDPVSYTHLTLPTNREV